MAIAGIIAKNKQNQLLLKVKLIGLMAKHGAINWQTRALLQQDAELLLLSLLFLLLST